MLVGVSLSCRKPTEEVGKAPEIEWMKTYGGFTEEVEYSIIQDFEGNLVVAGKKNLYEFSIPKAYVLKTNLEGNILWTKEFASGVTSELYDVKQTSDSIYILIGKIDVETDFASPASVYIIMMNEDGDPIWSKIYGGPSWECGKCVVENDKGEFIIGGVTMSAKDSIDVYFMKVDSACDSIWATVYQGDGFMTEIQSIDRCDDGNYIMVGSHNEKLLLIKIDDNGKILWAREYGGRYCKYSSNFIKRTSDGDYIIAGSAGFKKWLKIILRGFDLLPGFAYDELETAILERFPNLGHRNFYLFKIDGNGNILWNKEYGGKYHDVAFTVELTNDDGYIIAGYTEKSFAVNRWLSNRIGYIVKTDCDGNVLWEKTISHEGGVEFLSIVQNIDGGYAVTGRAADDIVIIKLKPEK